MSDLNDFSKLMKTASENRQNSAHKSSRCLKTTFKPPKKVSRQDAALSNKVKEFLAKKEEETRRENAKKDDQRMKLLEIRSGDSKAHKRVQLMRKSAKSASKSVMMDATADPLAAMRQPDEDDYGFSSKTESEMYNRMVSGFVAQNDDKKFGPSKKPTSNLSATKDRVRQALEREQMEAELPHRRKRKQKSEEDYDKEEKWVDYDPYGEPAPAPSTPVKMKKAPPVAPMNFSEMLQFAHQNRDKPMLDDELYLPISDKKPSSNEPERLMTKRQRNEYLKEKEFLDQKAQREKAGAKPPIPGPSLSTFNRIPKIPKIQREESAEERKEPSSSLSSARPAEKSSHDKHRSDQRSSSKPSKSERHTPSPSSSKSQSKVPDRNSALPKRPSVPEKSISPRPSAHKQSRPPSTEIKKRPSQEDLKRRPEQRRDPPPKSSSPNNPRPGTSGKILQSALQSKSPTMNGKLPPRPAPSVNSGKGRPVIRPASGPARPSSSSGRPASSQSRPDGRPGMPSKPATGQARPAGAPARPAPAQGRPAPAPSRPDGRPTPARPDGRPAPAPSGANGRPAPSGANGRPAPSGASGRPAPGGASGRPAPSGASGRPAPGGPNGRPAQASVRPNGGLNPVTGRPDGRPAAPARPVGARGPDGRPMGSARRPDGRPGGPPMRRPNGYPGGSQRPMKKKKMAIDSDSEYDSEMDDFIDDTPLQGEPDISSVLRDVFGYDKRKYAYMEEEDDDECMESSYGQINKEEFQSSKAGLMEDLADIQRKKAMKAKAKMRQQQR